MVSWYISERQKLWESWKQHRRLGGDRCLLINQSPCWGDDKGQTGSMQWKECRNLSHNSGPPSLLKSVGAFGILKQVVGSTTKWLPQKKPMQFKNIYCKRVSEIIKSTLWWQLLLKRYLNLHSQSDHGQSETPLGKNWTIVICDPQSLSENHFTTKNVDECHGTHGRHIEGPLT